MSKINNEVKAGIKMTIFKDKTPEEIKQIVEEMNNHNNKEG